MSSLDTEFKRRLNSRIDERIADISNLVCDGSLDGNNYKDQCGYLRALRDIKNVAEEIETLINEGK